MERPAYFSPSDGYEPPEDPLVGVARQIDATAALPAAHPRFTVVGAGCSYLPVGSRTPRRVELTRAKKVAQLRR